MIIGASEGWTALYVYEVEGSELVLSRMIAAWAYDPDAVNEPDARRMVGVVVDDVGDLRVAHDLDRFICYCAPDDKPEDVVKRRVESK